MDILRRVGQGRMAEIRGADLLPVDKFIRTAGLLPRGRDAAFPRCRPGRRSALRLTPRGSTPFSRATRSRPSSSSPAIARSRGNRPIVWSSGRSRPTSCRRTSSSSSCAPVSPPSSEQNGKLALSGARPGDPVTTLPAISDTHASDDDIDDELGALTGIGKGASNEWVVAGSRTLTGKPILANDPHLELSAPILWYLARVVTPEGSVKGATLPGAPVFVLGQNDSIAWGLTTAEFECSGPVRRNRRSGRSIEISDARRTEAVRRPRRDDPRERRRRRQAHDPRDPARSGPLRRQRRSGGLRRAGKGGRARLHRARRSRHDRRSLHAGQFRAKLGRISRCAPPLSDANPELRLCGCQRRHRLPESRAWSRCESPATGSSRSTARRAPSTGPGRSRSISGRSCTTRRSASPSTPTTPISPTITSPVSGRTGKRLSAPAASSNSSTRSTSTAWKPRPRCRPTTCLWTSRSCSRSSRRLRLPTNGRGRRRRCF